MIKEPLPTDASALERPLPPYVRTRGGTTFDPREEIWSYRDGVHTVFLDFSSLAGLSRSLEHALKMVLVWYAENRSAHHLINLFGGMKHFVRFLHTTSGYITRLSHVELLSYRASLDRRCLFYLGDLAALLKTWHALGHPGIEDGAMLLLKELQLKGNPKGVAVLTRDTRYGPYTDIELGGIHSALEDAYAVGLVDPGSYLLAQLFILLGQRPVQYAALKVCDVFVRRTPEGDEQYILRVPRAKQHYTTLRATFTDRVLLSDVGSLLVEYATRIEARYCGRIAEPSQAPLFPSPSEKGGSAPGFEYHCTPATLRNWLRSTLEKLSVRSERTGEPVHICPTRFRRTPATRAAEEGYGEFTIAALLDHTGTQNVGIYVEATPAIVKRIDRAVAMRMAPLAQAFTGVLIKNESEATRGNDPESRIVDPRIDPTMHPMGSCGQYGFCGLLAPLACYTCRNFQPWLDGPHEAVLDYLLRKREHLRKTTGERIASVEDRMILAVAEVIRRCQRIRARAAASQNDELTMSEEVNG
jgi:integrase